LSARRKARDAALKSLYAYESVGGDRDDIFSSVLQDLKLSEKPAKFASELYELTLSNIEVIDAEINSHAENWNIKRVALIDKNIMRIAICELLYFPDIPYKVSMNEAIELAKKFSTEESSGFVNGIINAVCKKHETELEA